MKNFEVNLFLIYYLSCIWHYKGDSSQNFTSILTSKIDNKKKAYNYNISKHQELIMLTIKFERYNN